MTDRVTDEISPKGWSVSQPRVKPWVTDRDSSLVGPTGRPVMPSILASFPNVTFVDFHVMPLANLTKFILE